MFTGLRDELGDATWRLEKIKQALKPLQDTLERYKHFKESLGAVQSAPLFLQVRDTIKVRPYINQALAHDPRYARLLQLYNRLLQEKVYAERAKATIELSGAEFYRYYQDYCLWTMLFVIGDLQFEKQVEERFEIGRDGEFITDITLNFQHRIKKLLFKAEKTQPYYGE
ncbi:MAG: hypothetical protein AB1523_01120 [Bacillota bacterium]